MGRDRARSRRDRSRKGGAMSNPRGNVPLSVQEVVRAALTDQEIGLLAFFGAPGFKQMRAALTDQEKALLAFFDAPGFNQMPKEDALHKLEARFFNANGTPLGGGINPEGANGESSNA